MLFASRYGCKIYFIGASRDLLLLVLLMLELRYHVFIDNTRL